MKEHVKTALKIMKWYYPESYEGFTYLDCFKRFIAATIGLPVFIWAYAVLKWELWRRGNVK